MDDVDTQVSRRQFLGATGTTAGAALLAGCPDGSPADGASGSGGGGENGTEAGNTSASGGGNADSMLDLVNDSMTSLDPIAASDTASGEVTTQLFDGLMTYPNGQVPVTSLIVKGYQLFEDFTTYTFTLEEGVQFHNGEEATAPDFAYAYERLAGSPNSLAISDIIDSVGTVHEKDPEGKYRPGTLATEAVDDYTFRFEMGEPFASTLQVIANDQFAAVPEGIVGDIRAMRVRRPRADSRARNRSGPGPSRSHSGSRAPRPSSSASGTTTGWARQSRGSAGR